MAEYNSLQMAKVLATPPSKLSRWSALDAAALRLVK